MLIATHNCTVLHKVKVRPDPSTANATEITMPAGTRFQISEIVPDRLDPTNTAKKWGHIFGGIHDDQYTALEYPGNPIPISSYTPIDEGEPDPLPGDPQEVKSSITISPNGITTIEVTGTEVHKNNLVIILNGEIIFQ